MSIAILQQVYDETRRLAIAGSNLAGDDFRLKKLIPPLQKAGEKAPVFAKVASAADKLINSPAPESAAALLELSTLTTAILYTQGQTGIEGQLTPIPTAEMELPASAASARVLKPLLEALATTGSGRLEIIRDAHQRGAFRDLRLVRPALAAIDDVYGEIGDMVADEILPLYDKTIYPEIREPFDHKGKGGHVRRLRLMHRLDPEATQDLVEQSLESGSKEMKLAALACLKGRQEALPLLLEQATARSKDVRETALKSLAEFQEQEAVDTLLKALAGSDLSLVAYAVRENCSPQVLAYLLEEAENLLEEMTTTKSNEKRAAALERFRWLLFSFYDRGDKQTLALISTCYDRRDELAALKGKQYDGEDINRIVATLMSRSGAKPLQKRLVADADALPPDMFAWAFITAIMTQTPKAVYDNFSPYLLAAKPAKRKTNDPVALKQEVVCKTLESLRHDYRRYHDYGHLWEIPEGVADTKLDDRWLDAAVKIGNLDLVMALARPNHKPTSKFLTQQFQQQLKKKDWHYETHQTLETMARIEHPEVVEHFLDALRKLANQKTRYYGFWWFGRIIGQLPRDAAGKIEAIVPSLPEPMIDELVPYLTELKAKK